MASSTTGGGHYFLLVVLSLLSAAAYGQLVPETDFYATKCSSLDQIIKEQVSNSLVTDGRRMGASLLRLHFHDCFVQGCDASVLLDTNVTKSIVSEKAAIGNFNSLRGFDVIDRIKAAVEAKCPGVVSCADILTLVTRQAVIDLGFGVEGWPLLLGRLDSKTANLTQANSDLPMPNSNLSTLIAAFAKKNFTSAELVVLSGGHTIGMAQCKNVDQTQTARCTSAININNLLLVSLDHQTPDDFDNAYYGNLAAPNNNTGLLQSDRVLMNDTDLAALVAKYASNQANFFQDFAKAMKKMSEMSVLTGTGANGEIRRNCSMVN